MMNLEAKVCPRCSVVQLRDPTVDAHEMMSRCATCGGKLPPTGLLVTVGLATTTETAEGSER